MKTNTFIMIALTGLFFTGCVTESIGPEGPRGQDGRDGLDGLDAEIYYSPWYTPGSWSGNPGNWYFQINHNAITEGIVEEGIILAYMSVPNDLYVDAVRPMPAYAADVNWDFLIPNYGTIEFTSDAELRPGTNNYYFRFVLIPSNIPLKAPSLKDVSIEELKAMSYREVCNKLGIQE